MGMYWELDTLSLFYIINSWYKYNKYCENIDMVIALKMADVLHLGVAKGN